MADGLDAAAEARELGRPAIGRGRELLVEHVHLARHVVGRVAAVVLELLKVREVDLELAEVLEAPEFLRHGKMEIVFFFLNAFTSPSQNLLSSADRW